MTGVELKKPEEEIIKPDWVGEEITNEFDDFEAELITLKPTKIEETLGMYPV